MEMKGREEVSGSGMKVGEVAKIAGISVRTLHHYDRIGLLKPTTSTPSGYRLYERSDLERLQQILFYRELDVPLEETGALLDRPGFDRAESLLRHREALQARLRRLERLLETVDRTLDAMKGDDEMTDREMFDAFRLEEIEQHRRKHEKEAEARYGHTDAWKESSRRFAGMTDAEKVRTMDRSVEIFSTIAALMDRPIDDADVQKEVGEWNRHIDRSFYPCPPEMFRGLAELYVADPRFTETFEKIRPGLAAFLSEAMKRWCDERTGTAE